VSEVAVAAIAEAVARHLDRRPEPVALEQVRELDALTLGQDGLSDREALLVELALQLVPIQPADAAGHAVKDCLGHPRTPSSAV